MARRRSAPESAERAVRAGAAGAAPRTRADLLHDRLAEEIVAGVAPPGTALDETELAARFGVSRTPVREALRRLQSSGLVDIRPHRGAVVARPDEKRLHDMFFMMAELEALAAGLSAVAMTPLERAALEADHLATVALVQSGDREAYAEANIAFHEAIYEGAHNGYLADLARRTRLRVAPFRKAQFQTSGRLAASFREHQAIVDAILRADRTGATEAMRAHIGTVEEAWEKFAASG